MENLASVRPTSCTDRRSRICFFDGAAESLHTAQHTSLWQLAECSNSSELELGSYNNSSGRRSSAAHGWPPVTSTLKFVGSNKLSAGDQDHGNA